MLDMVYISSNSLLGGCLLVVVSATGVTALSRDSEYEFTSLLIENKNSVICVSFVFIIY